MISINKYITENFESNIEEESRAGSMVASALTGLGGAFTGGVENALYNARKIEKAKLDNDFNTTGKPNFYKNDRTGKALMHAFLGAFPVIGSITNMMLASERWDELEKAKQTPEKAKQIAKEFKLKIVNKKSAKK